MAAGDMHVFDDHLLQMGNEQHDLNASDTIKMALVTNTSPPVETSADPHFGGTGTTDLSANEIAATGAYVAGGVTLANFSLTESAGTVTADADDPASPTWAQNGSSPTNARWAVIYNNTDTRKGCIAYIDLGAVIDMSAGDLTIAFGAGGIYTSTTTAGT